MARGKRRGGWHAAKEARWWDESGRSCTVERQEKVDRCAHLLEPLAVVRLETVEAWLALFGSAERGKERRDEQEKELTCVHRGTSCCGRCVFEGTWMGQQEGGGECEFVGYFF